jgi:hypothetical protein
LGFHRELEAAFAADVTRNHMDVEVGDALAGAFADVGQDVDAFGAQDRDLGLADPLGDVIDFVHQISSGRKEIVVMLLRHHQGVAFGGLRDVENGEHIVILVDFDRGDLPIDDFAENVFHGVLSSNNK